MELTDQRSGLPTAKPTLFLLGSESKPVLTEISDLISQHAKAVDIRSEVLWVEVPDGLAMLRKLIEHGPQELGKVRIAFAPAATGLEDLASKALLAPSLEAVAEQLDRADLASEPLDYEIRFQPVVRLTDQSIVGFEGLLRAKLGSETITANELIARATKGGWLDELDQMARQLAIRGIGPWLGAGLLFLNIMAPDGTFDLAAARRTIRHAEDIGLEPDQLVFEAAERNRYVNIDLAAAQLSKLRNSGVRIAIDDVGDGYSSLRVATSFKPDVYKLAGQLVTSLPSTETIAIVRAVVDLAHQTGAWVVAEHVETEEQADILRSLDVDWGQGNLFGSPKVMPIN